MGKTAALQRCRCLPWETRRPRPSPDHHLLLGVDGDHPSHGQAWEQGPIAAQSQLHRSRSKVTAWVAVVALHAGGASVLRDLDDRDRAGHEESVGLECRGFTHWGWLVVGTRDRQPTPTPPSKDGWGLRGSVEPTDPRGWFGVSWGRLVTRSPMADPSVACRLLRAPGRPSGAASLDTQREARRAPDRSCLRRTQHPSRLW
jgi:hypothetical protein